jgi:DNA-directed RNA polymerase subunit RPC12/RpoP
MLRGISDIKKMSDKIICRDCDNDKLKIYLDPNGIEVLCSQCNERVFFMGVPKEAMKELATPSFRGGV